MSLGACGSSRSAPAATSLFGPFAGYSLPGHPTTVTATITVPRILRGSAVGKAGTWIGAEGPSTGTNAAFVENGPFVQIGVNEERARELVGGRTYSDYYVFYSSEALDFHPQRLFFVAAGDRIALTMSLADGRWSLTARDVSSGRRRTLGVRVGGERFNLALWTQEDITDASTGHPYPYPRLSGTRFSSVQVDHHAPAAVRLRMTWMSAGTELLGPSRLSRDGFAILVEHPPTAALTYQRAVFPVDEAGELFESKLLVWSSTTPSAQIHRASNDFARALAACARQLRSGHWSPQLAPLIARETAFLTNQRQATLAIAAAPVAQIATERRTFIARLRAHQTLVTQLRSRFGVPLANPSSSALANYFRSHGG